MHGRRGLLLAAAAVFAWVLGGAVIYYLIGNCSDGLPRFGPEGELHDLNQCPDSTWSFGQSFYFSVQTGLSIGFGLLTESKWTSKAYSICHILIGSSVISGALALFASLALTRGAHFQSAEEKRLAEASARLHADGYKGFDLEELRSLMVTYPHYANTLIRKLEPNKEEAERRIKAFAAQQDRTQMANDILRDACRNLAEFKRGQLSIGSLESLEKENARRGTRAWRFLEGHRNCVVATAVLGVWISIGVLFSVTADENDFVTGLYFAVSTLSTAGMVAVKTVDSNAHVIFTAFYALLGVPIYCTCLGMFANVLVDRYNKRQVEDTMHAKVSEAEMEFLKHLSASHDHAGARINFSEFVQFQLLRMGKVDRALLDSLREHFARLDTNSSGFISKNELLGQPAEPSDDSRPLAKSASVGSEAETTGSPNNGASLEFQPTKIEI